MSSSDVQIQGSNDWSIISKLSTVQKGYFSDPHLHRFVARPSLRSSLINRGYYVRAKAVDRVLKQFVCRHKNGQIISLGAGFDASYFRLKDDAYSDIVYVELDFPEVVKRKWSIIKDDLILFELANCNQYHLHPIDLRDLKALEALLLDAINLNREIPTLFISECSITYMDEPSSSKLIEWSAQNFTNAVFCIYEQIKPEDGFGIIMQEHFTKLSIPLLSLPVHKTKMLQKQRFLDRGWPSCEVYDMNEFYEALISEEERKRITVLEAFDEFEGFHLKCSHYVILTASAGDCSTLLPPLSQADKILPLLHSGMDWRFFESPVRRYGHAGVRVDDKLWITGGFGPRPVNSGHGRLDDLLVISDVSSSEPTVRTMGRAKALARMYGTICIVSRGTGKTLVIFGGRTHPSNPLSDVLLYDIKAGDQLNNNGDFESITRYQTESPAPRWRHAACTLVTAGDVECILISGGRDLTSVLSDCWIMKVGGTPASRQVDWNIYHDLPSGRHSHSSSPWNDKVIVFGGLDQSERCISDLLVANGSQTWTRVSWNGPELLGRYAHQATVLNDHLVIVGGVSTSSEAGICIVNLLTSNWTEYSLPVQDPEHPVLLCGFSLAGDVTADGDVKIWCHGGGCNCFSFGTHLNDVGIEMTLKLAI